MYMHHAPCRVYNVPMYSMMTIESELKVIHTLYRLNLSFNSQILLSSNEQDTTEIKQFSKI